MSKAASDVATAVSPGKPAPSREELVERAQEIAPILWEDAAQADEDRMLTPRVVDAIADAGLFKLMSPKRLGGYETDAKTLLEVVAAVARGCGASAWVAGIINFTCFEVGLFPEQAQRDVWETNADARVCFVIAPSVEYETVAGGINVTGRWPNASGSSQSQWAALGVPMSFGPKGPEFSKALISMDDLTIEDTWFMSGVRGTASNTLVGKDVFVPSHRLLPLRPAALSGEHLNPFKDERLYRSHFSGMGTVAVIAPQLGLVDAALELVISKSQGKPIPAAGVRDQAEYAGFHMRLAEAKSKISSAWLLARRAAETIDDAATEGTFPSDELRGRIRMDFAWASQQLREALDILMSEAGFSAFADGSPLQRIWRDVSLISRHSAFRPTVATETYGRVLMGQGPGATFPF